jgi:hypothetical protein
MDNQFPRDDKEKQKYRAAFSSLAGVEEGNPTSHKRNYS